MIELKNIHFNYQTPLLEQTLFNNLHLQVKHGECLALVGPSGCGKTSLLKVMAGLLKPDSGSVLFDNRDIYYLNSQEKVQFYKQVGMTFQQGGLFDSLNCFENLELPLLEHSVFTAKERQVEIKIALERVGLAGCERLNVNELSGGMQKRLGIARALILKPSIVFYDEPTAGLDPLTAKKILELILQLKETFKMTLVLVTSEVVRAMQVSDSIAFLYQGKIQEVVSTLDARKTNNEAFKQFMHGYLTGPLTEGFQNA